MKHNEPGGCCCPSGFWSLNGDKAWSSATNSGSAPNWYANPGPSPSPGQMPFPTNCLGADYDRDCLILANGLTYDASRNSTTLPAVIEYFPAKAGSAAAWGTVYLTESQRNALLAPGPTATFHNYPTLANGPTSQIAIQKQFRKYDYLTQKFYGTAGASQPALGLGIWSAPKSGSAVTFHDLPLSGGTDIGVRNIGGPHSLADESIDPTTFSYPGYGNGQTVTVFRNDEPLCTMRTNGVLSYQVNSPVQAFSMTGQHWLDERLVVPQLRIQMVAYVSLTPFHNSYAGIKRSFFVDAAEAVHFTSILHPSFLQPHGLALFNNYTVNEAAPCGSTVADAYDDGPAAHYMKLPSGAMGGYFFDYANKFYYHVASCARYLAVTRSGAAATPVCYSWKGDEAYVLVSGAGAPLHYLEITKAPEEGETFTAIPMGGVTGSFGSDNVAVAVPNP